MSSATAAAAAAGAPEKASSQAEVSSSSPACHLVNDTPKLAGYSEPDGRLLRDLRQRRHRQDAAAPPLLLSAEDIASTVTRSSVAEKVSTRLKYPRISTSYPKIPQGEVSPEQLQEKMRRQAMMTTPPSSRPPVFLKCNVKKRHGSDDEDEDGEDDDKEREDEFKSVKNQQPTDLDIQFQQMNLENLTSPASNKSTAEPRKNSNNSQSLVQYCSFEEKKVVKVAPHIRRKDVICDTVDAWSRQGNNLDHPISSSITALNYLSDRPRYRPLIFGGTYPIDAPVNNAAGSSHKIVAGRHMSKTFDIDAPTTILE